MPNLTELQKHVITQHLGEEGITIRAIAYELNISKNTVLLAKQKLQEDQGLAVQKLPQIMKMINLLRLHPFQTAISARQETNFPAYLKTTRSRIKKSELNNRCEANKIFLTAQNKQQRVMFAQEYIHQNIWDAVVFSDKKTFQCSNSGRLGVYRLAGTNHNEEYGHATNRSGRFAVNVSALEAQEFVQLWRRG
jgi:transposase-like protein